MGRKSRRKAERKEKGKRRRRSGDSSAPELTGAERLLIGCALVGLAFSALLWAEYQAPGSGLCSVVGGGCDVVRASEWSSLGGVSMPTIGIGYFLSLLGVTLLPAARPALLPLAAMGGIAGVAFIGLQAFAIGAWCPFCLVVDLAAIVAAGVAFRLRGTPATPLSFDRLAKVGAMAIIALVPGALGGGSDSPAGPASPIAEPLPAAIAELQNTAPVAVVEFLDFQCPACNMQHRVFQEVLAAVDYDVEMVYLHAPLPQHPHAPDAARAFICAEEQGRGSAMADALFQSAAPTPEAIGQFAEGLGLDTEAFSRCLMSSATEERLRQDGSRATQVGLRSLPTFWIGDRKFVGVQEADVVREALGRLALRGRDSDAP